MDLYKCRIINPNKSQVIYPRNLCFLFVNKHFTCLGRVYLRKQEVLLCDTFGKLFLYKDENISRFTNLHQIFSAEEIMNVRSYCAEYELLADTKITQYLT